MTVEHILLAIIAALVGLFIRQKRRADDAISKADSAEFNTKQKEWKRDYEAAKRALDDARNKRKR